MAKISVGSIVRLKTGGPKMVVDAQNSDGTHLTCMWFRKKKLRTCMVHVSSLRHLKSGDEGEKKKAPAKQANGAAHA